jgi:hypothetical protein
VVEVAGAAVVVGSSEGALVEVPPIAPVVVVPSPPASPSLKKRK